MKDLFGRDKIEEAIERIRTFEPEEGYYLADSGGKDSCVMLELAKRARVKFDAHYNLTTIDPPEIVYFLRRHHPETKFNIPQMPFLKRLSMKAFPTRRMRWCCAEYKEANGEGRKIITGIRSKESNKRSGRRLVEQCLKDNSKTYINPIIDWTEDEVWEFIKTNNIPYCSLYDEGFKRLGCILCPLASKLNRIKEAQRWPRYTNLFVIAFERLWLNKKHRPYYQRWKNGTEMFNWWLYSMEEKENYDQTVMFE